MEWGPSHKKWRSEKKGRKTFGPPSKHKRKQATMVNRPPPSFFFAAAAIRSSRRGATQSTSLADLSDGSVAARRSWAAPGLSSGRFVVAAAAIYIDLGRI
jgi:hypothetical protein